MKKAYQNPAILIVKLSTHRILEGSDPRMGGTVNDTSKFLSRRGFFDDEDDE